jgi:hypothetical protein
MDTVFLINARFPAGNLVMTRGVADLAEQDTEFARFVQKCLIRHFKKDWGDVDEPDKKENDFSVDHNLRVLSAYNDSRWNDHGVASLWIITEADRSATTVLFPDEY